MTAMTDPAPQTSSDGPGFRAVRMILFTGLAIAATAMSFVFLPIAGLLIALLVGWTGYAALLRPGNEQWLRTLATLFFGAYAIVATAMAFAFLTWGGVLLAAMFLWRGADAFGQATSVEELGPQMADAAQPRNAAFEAYRTETLQRLEQEQERFDDFLGRLRAAKDTAEFDAFMDARAARTRADAAKRKG